MIKLSDLNQKECIELFKSLRNLYMKFMTSPDFDIEDFCDLVTSRYKKSLINDKNLLAELNFDFSIMNDYKLLNDDGEAALRYFNDGLNYLKGKILHTKVQEHRFNLKHPINWYQFDIAINNIGFMFDKWNVKGLYIASRNESPIEDYAFLNTDNWTYKDVTDVDLNSNFKNILNYFCHYMKHFHPKHQSLSEKDEEEIPFLDY